MGSLFRVRPSSSLSRRLRHVTRDIVRSEPLTHRTKVIVWTVFLVAIVLEGVLIMQPSDSSHYAMDPHSAIRAAPTTKAPAPVTKAPAPTAKVPPPTAKAPVPTVLPPASPATTLVPASAAEQAAFRAGQSSCQTSPAGSLDPSGSAEQAAFNAGHQWCSSPTGAGHHGSGTKR
jgi:hypothetical protein